MTAFSRVQLETPEGILCWEIRSVNQRYLDVFFRLPESFRFLESSLRSLLRGEIQRGKLECQLKFSEVTDGSTMVVNNTLINSLMETAEKIAGEHQLANDLTVGKLLQWPGIVAVSEPNIEALAIQVEKSFKEAIQELQNARLREGTQLKEYILKRIVRLKDIIHTLRANINNLSETVKSKFLARISNLGMNLEEGRIEQEVALMVTRLDITEEIDRLELHTREVERNLESKEPVGRRLDFLMQELNREANTLSSKSDAMELIQAAVDMKVLIEQMREQIQNIE